MHAVQSKSGLPLDVERSLSYRGSKSLWRRLDGR